MSSLLETGSQLQSKETRLSPEVPVNRRSVKAFFIRHTRPNSKDENSGLSPIGVSHAQLIGYNLANFIDNGELVKLYCGPAQRTQETGNAILEYIKEEAEARAYWYKNTPDDNIRILPSRVRGCLGNLETTDFEIFAKLANQGVDPIEEWLKKPIDSIESPEACLKRVKKIIKYLQYLSRRLPEGPRINIIAVTHGGPLEVLLRDFFEVQTDKVDYGGIITVRLIRGESGFHVNYRQMEAVITRKPSKFEFFRPIEEPKDPNIAAKLFGRRSSDAVNYGLWAS